MSKKVPTIKDVARMVGVAPSTVSRVISGHTSISEQTSHKVNEAIKQLGYTPNVAARSLVGGSSKTIAVILHALPEYTLNNFFYSEVLKTICSEANLHGYHILLVFSQNATDENNKIKDLILSKRADGMLLLTVRQNDQTLELLREHTVPFVVIGNPPDKTVHFVDNDNVQAMRDVVTTLLKDGFNKLIMLAGERDLIVTKSRIQGFREALKESKIKYSPSQLVYTRFTSDNGYKSARKILPRKPDAIICTDDLLALGAAKAVHEAGLDTVVIGFNNSNICELATPKISSVDIGIEQLGKLAIDKIVALIQEDDLPCQSYVNTKLIKRYKK